ncbi:hypothetical protein MHYMCMPSP_01143 [Hyalomma marginatum]|uniref:Uncharacterized protein n=1 Tax=Hyalomma marginatum TaxID=34627 RepID=A0A8S4C250_9ACAR|nr:hypothetical protein MHYMCMPASI_00482 [Hyalomma marginatum]CAG7598668.1 hypothetical protein MHYMCMPSP_01143 [Hyalomma marginatum]
MLSYLSTSSLSTVAKLVRVSLVIEGDKGSRPDYVYKPALDDVYLFQDNAQMTGYTFLELSFRSLVLKAG